MISHINSVIFEGIVTAISDGPPIIHVASTRYLTSGETTKKTTTTIPVQLLDRRPIPELNRQVRVVGHLIHLNSDLIINAEHIEYLPKRKGENNGNTFPPNCPTI